MDEQQEHHLVSEIVREQLPDETDLIGETTYQQIVQGYSQFEGGSTGLRADMVTIMAVVASAVGIVKGSMEIIKLWRELYGKEPTVEEVQSELTRRSTALREAADAYVKALITATLSRLPRLR
jgi:hypothetical protein